MTFLNQSVFQQPIDIAKIYKIFHYVYFKVFKVKSCLYSINLKKNSKQFIYVCRRISNNKHHKLQSIQHNLQRHYSTITSSDFFSPVTKLNYEKTLGRQNKKKTQQKLLSRIRSKVMQICIIPYGTEIGRVYHKIIFIRTPKKRIMKYKTAFYTTRQS